VLVLQGQRPKYPANEVATVAATAD
jgi:hypothetical protein